MPHKPCFLMKCAKATILLDAAVNLEPLSAFYPQTITGRFGSKDYCLKSSLFRYKMPGQTEADKKTLKLSLGNFIDAVPEVQPVSVSFQRLNCLMSCF